MILVTGASGLTGEFVVAELRRRGHAVRALARNPVAIDGVEVVTGDLGDVDSVARAVEGTTGIVHTACTYVHAAIDVAAMTALVDSWRAGSFVYISSLDVYGLSGAGVITEDTPPGELHNDYSRGKLACERLLERSGRRDHVSLRAPYIWGPHPTAYRRLVVDRARDPVAMTSSPTSTSTRRRGDSARRGWPTGSASSRAARSKRPFATRLPGRTDRGPRRMPR